MNNPSKPPNTGMYVPGPLGGPANPAGTNAPQSAAGAQPQAAVPAVPVPLARELRHAAQLCNKAKVVMTTLFEDVRKGRSVNLAAAMKLTDELYDTVSRNRHAFISLARLKTASDYTAQHAVAVSAMMIALGIQLGLDDAEVRSLGLAGLLHDIGESSIPPQVLEKPGHLTMKEFGMVKDHPARGHAMLERIKGIDPVVLDVCLHHHERVDGLGYPEGLTGDRLSVHAKMAAICNVYDSISSNRPYKVGMNPAEVLRVMASEMKDHFDSRLFQAFVKGMGIYPIGTLVRLQSGCLAVVTDQSQVLTAPKVNMFYHPQKGRIPVQGIDLSAAGVTEKIAQLEDPIVRRFSDLNQIWAGDGVIEAAMGGRTHD